MDERLDLGTHRTEQLRVGEHRDQVHRLVGIEPPGDLDVFLRHRQRSIS
jgi:hypothetical protein